MGRFSFGQVVLAYVSDGRGRTKERPCVVISSDRSNDAGEPLQAIAITGIFREPLPTYHVPLPWTPDGSGPTGLNKPSVAKCNWPREIDPHKVVRSLGFLPPGTLRTIVAEFDRLYEDESFSDWT